MSVATQDTGQSSCLGQLRRFICSFFSCLVNTLSFMSTSWVGPCLEKSALHRQVRFSQERGGTGGVTENSAERGSCSEEGPGGQSLAPALLHGPNISCARPPTLPTPILQPLALCDHTGSKATVQAEVTKTGMFHPFLLVCTGAFQASIPKSYS